MIDHDDIERSATLFDAAPDAFERFHRRRRRKQRNRQIEASLVALVLVSVAAVGTIRAFRSGGSSMPATPSERWIQIRLRDPATFDRVELRAVAAGASGYVAVGDTSGAAAHGENSVPVWFSTDGSTWSRVPSSTAPGSVSLWDITPGGPGYVAVGVGPNGGPAAWFSSNGTNWTQATVDPAPRGSVDAMFHVIGTSFGFIATGRTHGTDAFVWTSIDGKTWTAVPDESVFGGAGQQEIRGISAGGPGYVAVGYERARDGARTAAPVVWTSQNGVAWTRVTPKGAGFHAHRWSAMAVVFPGGPGMVAIGDAGPRLSEDSPPLWTSVDGVHWKRAKVRVVPQMTTVIETSSGLVGVGYDGVFTSNDGERWIPEPGAPGEGNGVAGGPQGLVVVGSGIWFERSAR